MSKRKGVVLGFMIIFYYLNETLSVLGPAITNSTPATALRPWGALGDDAGKLAVILSEVGGHELQILFQLLFGVLLREGDCPHDPLDLHGTNDASGKVRVAVPFPILRHEDLEHEGVNKAIAG